MPISIGDLVEITNGNSGHCGTAGIVLSIDAAGVAELQPVNTDDDWLTPKGTPIKVHASYTTKVPTPTDLRCCKRKLREKHLRELKPPPIMPQGGIREISHKWAFELGHPDTF